MNHRIFIASALILPGVANRYFAGTYNYGYLIATFGNPTGNDVEIDLGSINSLTTSGTEDLGKVSSLLSAAAYTVSSTYFCSLAT